MQDSRGFRTERRSPHFVNVRRTGLIEPKKFFDIVLQNQSRCCVDKLAKDIGRRLKERAFCVVFEEELERCWPSKKIERAERENQIQGFAKSRG